MTKTEAQSARATSYLAASTARAALAAAARELDPPVRSKAALVLQDFLGCCLRATCGEVGRSMASYCTTDPSAGDDALMGGILGHALIREDMHVPSGNHPGVVILPTMLALARRDGWTGAQLVRGIAWGYHFMATLGVAARTGLKERHFRPLGISGPFGAAAGALAAVGADEAVAVNALALAANFSAGVNQWAWSGGQDIYVHAGMAARNGIAALDLARAGMRGSPDILEGKNGLFAAIGSGPEASTVFSKRLEGPSCLLEVTHKPAAGCNHVQTAAAAALRLHHRLAGNDTRALTQVRIFTFSAARDYPGCNSQGPFDYIEQRKMSLQYAICAALRYGRLDEAAYASTPDAELLRLIACTEIHVDPLMERRTAPAQPARVELMLHNGPKLAEELSDVPWLNDTEVQQRFRAEVCDVLGTEALARTQNVLDAPWMHDDLTSLWWLWSELRRLLHAEPPP